MEQRLSTQRLIVGGLFIVTGGLLLVARFGLLDFDLDLWDLWTLLFPAVFVWNLLRRDWSGAIFFFFLSALFLGPRFFPAIDMGDILAQWPVVLVVIGLSLVVRSFLPSGTPKKAARSSRESALLGNTAVRPEDAVYRGGEVTALLGVYKLDLREIELAPGGAVLEVFAFWGGIEVLVPKGMAVDQGAMAIMGGAEDKSEPPRALPADAPRLEIRGLVMMAGLEVKN